MTLHDLANPEVALNNPLAIAIYVAAMALTGAAVNASAKYGWRGSRWVVRRTARAFRAAEFLPRTHEVLHLLDPAAGWDLAKLPVAANRKTPNGESMTVSAAAHAFAPGMVTIAGVDVLYGLPRADRKAVFARAKALLDSLQEANIRSRLACTTATQSPDLANVKKDVGADGDFPILCRIVAAGVLVTFNGKVYTLRDMIEAPITGSDAGGSDVYVCVPLTPALTALVRVAQRTSERDRGVVFATLGVTRCDVRVVPSGKSPY